MADTPLISAGRQAFDDSLAEARLQKVRARIRANFPAERAALTWAKRSATRNVSKCGRFAVDKVGDGEAARFNAILLPNSLIGHRRFTYKQAIADCENHASPLPLEPPPAEREPGCDDE